MITTFTTARDTALSVAGSIVFSAILVAAAVVPATAYAATFHL